MRSYTSFNIPTTLRGNINAIRPSRFRKIQRTRRYLHYIPRVIRGKIPHKRNYYILFLIIPENYIFFIVPYNIRILRLCPYLIINRINRNRRGSHITRNSIPLIIYPPCGINIIRVILGKNGQTVIPSVSYIKFSPL